MTHLFLIAGTTASGKTEFAIDFAKKNNCEIISCDASAFYKGMNIGTAKPSLEERQQIPHWGIDLIQPNEAFSIQQYVNYIQSCVNKISKKGKNILVVGGSGFYLKTFLEPVTDTITPSEQVIQRIKDLEQEKGLEGLVNTLKELNTEFPPNFDLKNPRKIRKALERCWETRESLLNLYKIFKNQPKPFPYLKKECYYLICPLEILKLRIAKRTQQMIQKGLIEEVKTLLKKHLLIPDTPAASAIGYRETITFLQQPNTFNLAALINKNTLALAKKQATWFRHQIRFDRYIFTQ